MKTMDLAEMAMELGWKTIEAVVADYKQAMFLQLHDGNMEALPAMKSKWGANVVVVAVLAYSAALAMEAAA